MSDPDATEPDSELVAIGGLARLADCHDNVALLYEALGKPRKASKSLLVYDNRLPNVMVVVNDDPKSDSGQKGVGMLVVRYYDPAPPR